MSQGNWKKAENMMNDCCEKQDTKDISAVLSAVNLLEDSLNELAASMDHLEGKLKPISCEPVNSPCCEGTCSPRRGSSTMAEKLWDFADMTTSLIQCCNKMIDRLEI